MFAVLLSLLPAHALAAPCQFVLGFAQMAAAVAEVGQCKEDQHFAPNGDAQQATTGGLLAWRKADNGTAFTDGYRTWLMGPHGLQRRLNTEQFAWEQQAVSPPTPQSASSGAITPTGNPALSCEWKDRLVFNDATLDGPVYLCTNVDGTWGFWDQEGTTTPSVGPYAGQRLPWRLLGTTSKTGWSLTDAGNRRWPQYAPVPPSAAEVAQRQAALVAKCQVAAMDALRQPGAFPPSQTFDDCMRNPGAY
jgi:hypothetical protein